MIQNRSMLLPCRKVAAYTGIFKVAKTEDDLSIVVVHEIVHVAAGHGNERVS
jgi:predicted Zn-dependent protease